MCALTRLRAKNELVTLKINIMKKLVTFIAIIFLSVSVFGQTQWKVDPFHSSLNFNIAHSGISIVNGKFLDYTGTLTTDGTALTGGKFDFSVKINSINTNVEPRDKHLISADFFDAEKYPTMTFKSTNIKALKKKGESESWAFCNSFFI